MLVTSLIYQSDVSIILSHLRNFLELLLKYIIVKFGGQKNVNVLFFVRRE